MPLEITSSRLRNQRLRGPRCSTPEDAVSWMGAVQAQEYGDAKWALSLRTGRTTDAAIEGAIAGGTILRTHVLRPTWHFVAAADIRWMLALTGPRVSARMAPYNRQMELDADVFRRSRTAIVNALGGGAQLTRQEIKAVLQRAGIEAGTVQRLAHLVMQAEVDGVVCSGARKSGQFTYALLDERVPASRALTREEALAELTRRYFTSHGPAQVQDFVWWSGLTVGDARAGLASAEDGLHSEVVDGKTYWFSSSARAAVPPGVAYLLPLYDEYLIAYRDRSAALDPSGRARTIVRDPFNAPIVLNGRVVGGWRRTLKSDRALVSLTPYRSLTRAERSSIASAAEDFAAFNGLPLELTWM